MVFRNGKVKNRDAFGVRFVFRSAHRGGLVLVVENRVADFEIASIDPAGERGEEGQKGPAKIWAAPLILVGPLGPIQLGDGGDGRKRLGQDGGDGRIVECQLIVGRVVGPGFLLIGNRFAERFGGFADCFLVVADRGLVSVKAIIARLFGGSLPPAVRKFSHQRRLREKVIS
nr:hypothetical protein [Lignipirellula cremea]